MSRCQVQYAPKGIDPANLNIKLSIISVCFDTYVNTTIFIRCRWSLEAIKWLWLLCGGRKLKNLTRQLVFLIKGLTEWLTCLGLPWTWLGLVWKLSRTYLDFVLDFWVRLGTYRCFHKEKFNQWKIGRRNIAHYSFIYIYFLNIYYHLN